jgi:hypothetical protein
VQQVERGSGMSAQAATKGTEDLKSTLVLDLCQGILETPCFDAACPPSYEQLRVAFEELHDVATTLARHLVVSLSDGLTVSESPTEGRAAA